MKSKKEAAPNSKNDSKSLREETQGKPEEEHGLNALVVKTKKQNEVLRKLIEKINESGQQDK